jgi:hypothetical protein
MERHKIIDALRGTTDDIELAISNMPAEIGVRFLEYMTRAAAAIEQAQVFEFLNVPVEQDGEGSFDLPGVDEVELGMWRDGIIPVPFPACWFEIPVTSLHGKEVMCYYIEELDGRSGMMVTPFRLMKLRTRQILQFTGEFWRSQRRGSDGTPTLVVEDPFGGAADFMKATQMATQEIWGRKALDRGTQVKGEAGLLHYLLVMLVSRTTETTPVEAPVKLNKQRAQKGRSPIPPSRVVSIIPKGIAAQIRRDDHSGERGEGGTIRSSPRLHWRRSHLRTTASGKTIPVARALVGYKAADGREFVPHEYRVDLQER